MVKLKRMTIKPKLLLLFPNNITTYGIGHAALSIAEAMHHSGFDCVFMVPAVNKNVGSDIINKLIPSYLMRVVYKLLPSKLIHRFTEFFFLYKIKQNDVVYLWPGFSIEFFRRVKAKGNIVVIENINCHQKISKEILDDESERLGLQHTHLITQSSIDVESETLKYCNFVFSPSPTVTQSLLDTGVPSGKILQTSYGLHEWQQVEKIKNSFTGSKPLEVVFVGRVGMRKGVLLLLEYWQEANINGVLKIVGNVEESIKGMIEPYRKVKNIQFIDFVLDIENVYQEADVFVLPSLEEGSPLVTYLALGAGLPCIVSPMGGQGVVTHNHDGFVIDPHNKSAWVAALQNLANQTKLREAQACAARESSNRFLWKKVGQQRADLLLGKLQGK